MTVSNPPCGPFPTPVRLNFLSFAGPDLSYLRKRLRELEWSYCNDCKPAPLSWRRPGTGTATRAAHHVDA